MTGAWPDLQIDHINRDQLDNRWLNLRQATASQNGQNRGSHSVEKNVSLMPHKRLWRIKVFANGKRFCAYTASSISAVIAARLIRRTMQGEFAI